MSTPLDEIIHRLVVVVVVVAFAIPLCVSIARGAFAFILLHGGKR